MPKYAKDQSVDFKNTIERVAIVGVSKPLGDRTYETKLNNAFRLEVPLGGILPTPFYRPEGTQSRPFLAKAAGTDSPRASSSP